MKKTKYSVLERFLLPTLSKIIIFILLMVILTSFLCLILFPSICLLGCQIYPDGGANCPQCPVCNMNETIPYSLLLILPSYFISCIIVSMFTGVKNNLKNRSIKNKKTDISFLIILLIEILTLFFTIYFSGNNCFYPNPCSAPSFFNPFGVDYSGVCIQILTPPMKCNLTLIYLLEWVIVFTVIFYFLKRVLKSFNKALAKY